MDCLSTFTNRNKVQFVSSPAILALNLEDEPSFTESDDLKMDIVYFSPLCLDKNEKTNNIEQWTGNLGTIIFISVLWNI